MLPHGSRFVKSKALEKTKLPPYWGLPSLSHQFPAAAVVVTVDVVTLVVVVVEVVEKRCGCCGSRPGSGRRCSCRCSARR